MQPFVPADSAPILAPTSASERIRTLDVLRGAAVLGILLMNITGFAFMFQSYVNPTVAGGDTGPNMWVYLYNMIFVDGKMRGIFSLLFGAGVLLFTLRREQRGVSTADLYYRRTIWLMVMGVIHSFVLWYGEVLYPYALCGFFLYPVRNVRARNLLIAAAVFLTATAVVDNVGAWRFEKLRDQAMHANALSRQGKKLTEEQEESVKKYQQRVEHYQPTRKEIQKHNDAFAGGFFKAIPKRIEIVMRWDSSPLFKIFLFDAFGMMLLGMALLKFGFLTGELPHRVYVWTAVLGYAIGIPIGIWMDVELMKWRWEIGSLSNIFRFYQLQRIPICLAHIAVFILLIRANAFRRIMDSLAAVGQMALTNYLMQSIICTLVFTVGHQFGKWQRYQVYYLVLAIWVVELAWSPIWLRHFRFGPFEWLWRSLTYWKRQPMRIQPALESIPDEPSPEPA